MAKLQRRIPKKGDCVSVASDSGTFAVYSVDHDIHTVEVKQIGRGLSLRSIPWDSLTFLDELDASQNALRIVREATRQVAIPLSHPLLHCQEVFVLQ